MSDDELTERDLLWEKIARYWEQDQIDNYDAEEHAEDYD